MLGEWPVWKQLLAALVALACMWAGTAYVGMCGGITFGVAAFVLLQLIAWATKQPRPDDCPPES